MADFTNGMAMGTQRVNPSSMVPGSTGNAPQGGFKTQMSQNSQMNALASQLAGGAPASAPAPQGGAGGDFTIKMPVSRFAGSQPAGPAGMPAPAPAEAQVEEAPVEETPAAPKKKKMGADEFNMLADVFKALAGGN